MQGLDEMKEEYRKHESKVFGVNPLMEKQVASMEERLVSSMINNKQMQALAPAAVI